MTTRSDEGSHEKAAQAALRSGGDDEQEAPAGQPPISGDGERPARRFYANPSDL